MQILNWWDVLYSAGFVGFAMLISWQLKLKLSYTLLIAMIRTITQLSLIGLILAWVFDRQAWYQVFIIVSIMTLIAAFAAIGRSPYTYKGLLVDSLLALTLGACTIGICAIWVLQISPWYSPQFLIPIIGMILGNALTAISLTINSLSTHLNQQSHNINALLALSASPKEAIHDAIRNSIHSGITPTINAMMVVGVVSLPGMMTGQILAGSDPMQAVRYQIVILFFICASSMASCVIIAHRMIARYFDSNWRLVMPPSNQSSNSP